MFASFLTTIFFSLSVIFAARSARVLGGQTANLARIALATSYRTVALHRVAADAHAALGETSAAAEELARCIAINPSCEAQQHAH